MGRYNTPKDCPTCYNRSSNWGKFQGRAPGTRGFDIDAKVQVFETTIRGVGGLLSAHLFATNALPSLPEGYRPSWEYKDELLLLAEDLGKRLLPALTDSPTGIPYPRINLRHGLPQSIRNPRYYTTPRRKPFERGPEREHESEEKWRHPEAPPDMEVPSEETTGTCTAGAGSLVLEFTLLSRLTDNPVYEVAAKKAFDEVWRRRSALDLVGSGINAETGLWEGANTGIGAGVDSFFEYAYKSYILMSRNEGDDETTMDESYFHGVWTTALAALKKHALVTSDPAIWWNNIHLATGEALPGGNWIDSLGAFFPGVLSADQDLELAIRGHLTYSALWSRYHALPERYNTKFKGIEGGLGWWPGRPEHIESTYLLYRATKDPLFLHLGKQIMEDLTRRCKTSCGWAGLQDVETGGLQDRMESFWLSETFKYLFLLFDEENPLHSLDTPWVFTTEGHPIILPRSQTHASTSASTAWNSTCPCPVWPDTPFSPLAGRPDIFHPAAFVNTSFTLPSHLVPADAISARLPAAATTLLFPQSLTKFSQQLFTSVGNQIHLLSLAGLRVGLDADMRISSLGAMPVPFDTAVVLSTDLLRDVVFDTVFWVGPAPSGAEAVLERIPEKRPWWTGLAGFDPDEEIVLVAEMFGEVEEGEGMLIIDKRGTCMPSEVEDERIDEEVWVLVDAACGEMERKRKICEGLGKGCNIVVKRGALEGLDGGEWRVKFRRKMEAKVQGRRVKGLWIV